MAMPLPPHCNFMMVLTFFPFYASLARTANGFFESDGREVVFCGSECFCTLATLVDFSHTSELSVGPGGARAVS